MLNKEFSKQDIIRMRNLITGDTQEKTSDIVGYKHKDIKYKEGDIWVEGDKTWVFKDGIISNVTKLDKIKNLIKLPLFCPKCSKPMKNRNDKVFYPIHKMCFDCVIVMETKLKLEGKWEEYENKIHNEEIDARIEEFINMLDSSLEESNDSFITEDGKIEKWEGRVNRERVEEFKKAGIEYFKKLKR